MPSHGVSDKDVEALMNNLETTHTRFARVFRRGQTLLKFEKRAVKGRQQPGNRAVRKPDADHAWTISNTQKGR
jgi:hypothetical protein